MAPIRRLAAEQEPFLTARSLGATYSRGYVIQPHTHGWHQLLYACTGAMTVFAGSFSWMIPPGKAVVIPAGCLHSIRMWGDVAMRSIYFPASVDAPVFATSACRVISVTPLLRATILRVVDRAGLDARDPRDAHLMALLLDEIDAPPEEPLVLPMPQDPRALPVAQQILSAPASDETLQALARQHGASSRTLERVFRGETGMSFGVWRQKARLLWSIRILAAGGSVTEAALDSGYGSVSAFIAAFKQTFGSTPGTMMDASGPGSPGG